MQTTIKIVLTLSILTVLGLADTGKQTFALLNKQGDSTLYVHYSDEYAVTYKQTKHPGIDLKKKLEIHPSYTLYRIQKHTIKANALSATPERCGSVYYKYGIKDKTHRYISTGEVIVKFATATSKKEAEEFGKQFSLKPLKVLTPNTVLFSNRSKGNDIDIASKLVRLPGVVSAKPNWILPVTLY